MQQGDYPHGRDVIAKCLRMRRRTGNLNMIALELCSLGVAYRGLGDETRARELLEESLGITRETGNTKRLAAVLTNLAALELDSHRPSRAIEFLVEAEEIDRQLGDTWGIVVDQVNRAGALIEIGRADQALALLGSIADDALALADTDVTATVIELCAICLGLAGDPQRCAQLCGTAAALREQAELPLSQPDAAFYERHLEQPRRTLGPGAWQASSAEGRHWSAAEALDRALK
jgi:tetratricopeptide (TPR) repeat protein